MIIKSKKYVLVSLVILCILVFVSILSVESIKTFGNSGRIAVVDVTATEAGTDTRNGLPPATEAIPPEGTVYTSPDVTSGAIAEAGTTRSMDETPPTGPAIAAPAALVEYKGPVRHIFFHPLILHPEKAFSGGSLSQGFNDWFVTVSEFKQILQSIYEQGFILVKLEDICSVEEQQGAATVQRKPLLVPEGKKPLVISIDDMNYYDYMIDNGCASRLYFDRQGEMIVESKDPDGNTRSGFDDIVPMVDEFVRQHPDFSLNGAKGIIALTGYQGILGYRTNQKDSVSYAADQNLARVLSNMLKEDGWTFACHGYGHLDAVKVSTERLERDCRKWKDEVEPLIGETAVYIYPYGSSLKFSDEKFKLLKNNGFRIFCGVGPDGVIDFKGDFAYLERKSIDGVSLLHHSPYLKDLFDCDKVLDPARPRETGKAN